MRGLVMSYNIPKIAFQDSPEDNHKSSVKSRQILRSTSSVAAQKQVPSEPAGASSPARSVAPESPLAKVSTNSSPLRSKDPAPEMDDLPDIAGDNLTEYLRGLTVEKRLSVLHALMYCRGLRREG
ncbi:hypothetical protein CONLIGDRAFT_686944 [Coniochaeta ligniaria NRRL 30616]|uniref:Uncharacterized protein n=1 Tax=Coniochaeta ligniaria NRRL 30616 TaxID=1408157 RepID=A0A1J7I743_9PEZI|nr:hypothetical protein CONLIGDRAFT_686944 [Coniochaeta ligniaria NRRL 30616]